MGSRKRRRERDEGRSSRRRHSRSHSRSPARDSRSRTRSRSPIPPPPPILKEKDDRHDREHDERRSHRSKREHRHRHHHRDRSGSPSKSSRHRPSKQEIEIHSDSSDCVEVVPTAPPAPVISKATKEASPIPENGAGDSLSIEETNKLRAKLGLKPLEVNSGKAEASSSKPKVNAEGNELRKDDLGEFYHKPANNIAEKLQADKLREKFRQNKEKRALEAKLKATKTLGESDEDDDITKWVDKNRDKASMKADAQRRAKLLQEMDDHYDQADSYERKPRPAPKKAYTDNHLKGLRVEHDVSEFTEGKSIILTLKDQHVLDEENEDTLVNVNMVDNEKYRKNVDNKKLNPNHYGYNVYEEQVDEFGDPIQRDVLSKYDEELGGSMKTSFVLGSSVEQEIAQKKKMQEIKAKLSGRRLETLDDTIVTPASDTYTESEMAKFKKPKKKIKKLRQKLKAEDLQPLDEVDSSRDHRRRDPNRHLSDVLDTDDVILPTTSDIKLESEENELEHVLSKARRLKQVEAVKSLRLDTTKIKTEIKMEAVDDDGNELITMNETAEFCRTLGDIPTYGASGNRSIAKNEFMDIESEPEDEPVDEERVDDEPMTGQWSSVEPGVEAHLPNPVVAKVEVSDVAILDEEPDVSSGMGAALRLALSKGYLEKEESNRPSNTRMAHLQAKNYSIEDKTHGDDDKHGRRDRFHSGITSDFKDKEHYKPNVKLEYIDDSGRLLNEKEAFRYLSHKFHGKGPGKNKIEKRLKKSEQETLMMKMSSTDTPLGTLTMLQQKQKETHSPFVVLSGSKQTQSTSITKYK